MKATSALTTSVPSPFTVAVQPGNQVWRATSQPGVARSTFSRTSVARCDSTSTVPALPLAWAGSTSPWIRAASATEKPGVVSRARASSSLATDTAAGGDT